MCLCFKQLSSKTLHNMWELGYWMCITKLLGFVLCSLEHKQTCLNNTDKKWWNRITKNSESIDLTNFLKAENAHTRFVSIAPEVISWTPMRNQNDSKLQMTANLAGFTVYSKMTANFYSVIWKCFTSLTPWRFPSSVLHYWLHLFHQSFNNNYKTFTCNKNLFYIKIKCIDLHQV